MVDIVIGTHRVLSADVKFKDLGLLIIDEEQRFGVAHKEKIKKLKRERGCADPDGNPDSPYPAYEPHRYPGYERAGGGLPTTGCRSRLLSANTTMNWSERLLSGEMAQGRTGLLCLQPCE